MKLVILSAFEIVATVVIKPATSLAFAFYAGIGPKRHPGSQSTVQGIHHLGQDTINNQLIRPIT
jgi:hypothetical protein